MQLLDLASGCTCMDGEKHPGPIGGFVWWWGTGARQNPKSEGNGMLLDHKFSP